MDEEFQQVSHHISLIKAWTQGPSTYLAGSQLALARDGPLETSESIRLLRRTSADGDVPQFLLKEYALDKCPSFVALSYTWSPPYHNNDNGVPDGAELKFNGTIGVNGNIIQATQNMVDALACALQHTDSQYFWMDQCCINQGSASERTGQVALMHRIYESASEVIVWLGGYHPYAQSFRWIVNELGSVAALLLEHCELSALAHIAPVAAAFGLGCTESSEYERRQEEAEKFYVARRYFERTWVRQEVVLAKRQRMFCSEHEIMTQNMQTLFLCFSGPWSTSSKCWRGIDEHGRGSRFCSFGLWLAVSRAYEDGSSIILPTPRTMASLAKPVVGLGGENLSLWTLWQLVSRLQQTTCSDPRDKIYAALPVSIDVSAPSQASLLTGYELVAKTYSRTSGTVPRDKRLSSNFIKADYSKPARQIYIDFCTLMIRETSSLFILPYVDSVSERQLDLPSWVKDFSSKCEQPLSERFSAQRLFDQGVDALGLKTTIRIRGETLSSFGAPFATISKRTYDPRSEEPRLHLISLLQLISDSERYIHGAPRVEALWRTMINDMEHISTKGDQIQARRPASESVGGQFLAWVSHTLVIIALNDLNSGKPLTEIKKWLQALLDPFRTETSRMQLPYPSRVMSLLRAAISDRKDVASESERIVEEAASAEVQEHVDRATNAFEGLIAHSDSRSRPLFRTAEGFLGHGPLDLCIGDQIWFVHSCAVPLIFRQRHDTSGYTLIGAAYLHGFLNTDKMFESKYCLIDKWQKFTLV